ncbi:MAG: hypothetical protein IK096_02090, partial [Lachnospiraceae bacterium]|nr:hypothetical protein [Lachnospiraceae bacterium]
MRIKRVATVYTLLMLFALFLFLRLYNRTSVQKRDIVFYNDLLWRIEDDLSGGREISAIEKDYDCRIVTSKVLDDPELAELYSEEAFVLDLVIDGEYVGKVAWLDKQNERKEYGAALLKNVLLLWGLTLLMGYAAFLVIYFFYIRPVDDLKKFSEELAKGNLDTPLPIRRGNLFGGFSEAFDIMREEL